MIPVTKSLEYFDTLTFPYTDTDQLRWNKFMTYHCPTIKETTKFFKKVKSYLAKRRVRRYFITLTHNDINIRTLIFRMRLIENRYKGEIDKFCIELTEKGVPHIHCILMTREYPRTRELYNSNNKLSVKCDLLRTNADVNRCKKYMRKDLTDEQNIKFLSSQSYVKPIDYISE